MPENSESRQDRSARERDKGKSHRDQPETPADSLHDEPKGTPSSDRYHTEIATAKLKHR